MSQGKAAEENLMGQVQSLLDKLRTFSQYARYVDEHNLGIIDENLAEYDALLDAGVLH